MKIPLGTGAYQRAYAKEPEIKMHNRFFEQNPTNLVDGVALISRPATQTMLSVDDATGPARAQYYREGAFNGDLFSVFDDTLYRISHTPAVAASPISGTLSGTGSPSMTVVGASFGAPNTTRLFIADGSALYYYDGVAEQLHPIATPDNVGIVSVATLAQYVICVVANSQRFYWIEPGEVTIDPLNFAEAEQTPDGLISARVVGDRLYLLGSDSTEVWYATGDATLPFLRQQGQAFSEGVVEGTDVSINDTLLVISEDGIGYIITGGVPQPFTTPYIAERVREMLEAQ